MEKSMLIKRNVVEIITEKELEEILEKKRRPVAYCGYEPSGPLHLGHLVTLTKLQDFEKAGFEIRILLADVHAFLNKKGSREEIKKETELWKKLLIKIIPKAKIIKGSSFQFEDSYLKEVFTIAQKITITRGLRAMQEIARNIENATISQVFYPLMQIVDIKYIGADIALGGLEQRKVHMLGKEMQKFLGHKFIAFHVPLISSLKKPEEKMSKSIEGSFISVTDSYEIMRKKILDAYCPEKDSRNNPIMQIIRLIIFPKVESFKIKREKSFGGEVEFSSYSELECAYNSGKIHPLDLKNSVVEYLRNFLIKKNEV
ncbi:MAG: tyrosine--tRNA ligase [Candidatus Pacearchaeota archaeon]|nr:tyrosine--tRNA ligase [Candidatus Pacearchaeota archaeon]